MGGSRVHPRVRRLVQRPDLPVCPALGSHSPQLCCSRSRFWEQNLSSCDCPAPGAPQVALVEKRRYVAKTGDIRDAGSIPGSGRSPGRECGNHSSLLPGGSHGRRSLVGHSPQGHTESDTTEATWHKGAPRPPWPSLSSWVNVSLALLLDCGGFCGGMVPTACQVSPWPRGGPAPGCLLWPCLPGLVEVLFPSTLLLRLPARPPASLLHLRASPQGCSGGYRK